MRASITIITGDHAEECTEVLVECYNEGCEEIIKRSELDDCMTKCASMKLSIASMSNMVVLYGDYKKRICLNMRKI